MKTISLLKISLISSAMFSLIFLSSCAKKTDCEVVKVEIGTDDACPAGGEKCKVENAICEDGWIWDDNCVTKKDIRGVCSCVCE